MKIRQFVCQIVMGVLLAIGLICQSWAHHPSHVSTSQTQNYSRLFLQDSVAKPASQFYFVFEAAQLDSSLGQIYTFVFGGEYALTKRISFGGAIPLTDLDHNFRSTEFGLGDILVNGKILIYENQKLYVFVNSEWSLPTGDQDKGFGRGNVAQTISSLFAYQLGEWMIYVTPGIQFGYESEPTPLLVTSLGVSSPRIFSNRVSGVFSFVNTVYLQSDVFSNGSGKLFAQPQINFHLDQKDKWTLSVWGKISVYDYLSKRSGVTLSSSDNALLSDIIVSGAMSLNFNFK